MKDYTGQKQGKLTAISFAYTKNGKTYWLFRCDCGKEFVSRVDAVFNGKRKKYCCGCEKKSIETHGMSYHPLMSVWADIKQRCLNPKNASFYRYGGRGIKICDEWENNSQAFFDWAFQNGYKENLSIDRIDPNGNYLPENCRWTDKSTQSANRRSNGNISYLEKKKLWRLRIAYKNKVLVNKYAKEKETLLEFRNKFIIENNLPHPIIQ